MRPALTLVLLLSLSALVLRAQQSTGTTTLTVRTNLVEVPALVTTKAGEVVFALTADDFVLTDNGASQRLTLVQDADSQPLV